MATKRGGGGPPSAAAAAPAAEPQEPRRTSKRPRREVDYSAERHEEFAVASAPRQRPAAAYRPPQAAPQQAAAPIAADPDKSVKRNAKGELLFADEPTFRPNLTPRQVIAAGSFGGCYFHPRGGRPGIISPQGVDIDHREFPAAWFAGQPESAYVSRKYKAETNRYRVKAGQNQTFWEEKGWINKQDPRGWFHWYCRFYRGRRTEDDERQISRWRGVAGAKGRWKRALLNKIVAAGARWDDASISPVIRQTLLHWALEVTEADVAAHAAGR